MGKKATYSQALPKMEAIAQVANNNQAPSSTVFFPKDFYVLSLHDYEKKQCTFFHNILGLHGSTKNGRNVSIQPSEMGCQK
jgi:hypothetical protein